MGKLDGYRQVTLYVDPKLYERVRCHAYEFGEDIYEFMEEALKSAIKRRTTKAQRDAIDSMAARNIKNGANRTKRR